MNTMVKDSGNQIVDTDYLFLTTRVRSLETYFLTQDRTDQMLSAENATEAAKVLIECGYEDLEEVNVDTVNDMLSRERDRVINDIYLFVPDKRILDIFKIKYDYHNVKVYLKSEATGVDAKRLMVDTGRIPVSVLENSIRTSDMRNIPSTMSAAIEEARDVLGTTRDPQLSDFVLDNAYFTEMFEIAKACNSKFLMDFVRLSIDCANIRSIVRTVRMKKGVEFLSGVLFSGGNVSKTHILSTDVFCGSIEDLYATSVLNEAAEAATAAMSGGSLTLFEKCCDNAINSFIKKSRQVSFGDAPLIAYLVAKENELTTIRIIMTGLLAGLSADTIRERLRESFV